MLLANHQGEHRRFCRVATNIKHVCGMLLNVKRYIGRNSVVEWALFHLQMQIHSRKDLLFNISNFSKNNMRKDFEKLKSLLSVRPKQRTEEILRQIQYCLKKNRAFQGLPDKTQLELCKHVIYQEYESKTLVIKQGHIPSECYIILSGSLAAITEDSSSKKKSPSSITLYEVEEGDFVGDIGLVTNERRTSFVCKSDVELLVIDKETFNEVLSAKVQEEHSGLCDFLRSLPLFSSWPSEKIDLLVHCSLQRYYRAGTTVVVDSTKSSFLVFVKSGKCLIMVQITQERPSTASSNTGKYCSLLNRFPTLPFLLEKRESSAYPAERSLLPRVSHSAYYRNASNQMHMRARPQTAGPSTVSLRDRNNRCDLVCADKRLNDKGVRGQQHENTSLPPRFVTVGTLGYGGVFGLAELITKSTNLRYSLISEGAECIFIPTKLFLSEAPIKSKQIAQELVNTFPTETKIRESYATLQRWTAYKDRLIEKQLNGGMKYQHHRK